MNQYPQGQTPPPGMPEWFIGDQTVTPKRGPSRGKKILVVIIAVLALMAGALAFYALSSQKSSPTCLNEQAYQEFTGEPAPDYFSPAKNFFTFPVDFISGTTTYDNTDTPTSDEAIKAMGLFYASHSTIKQTYTLTGIQPTKDDWPLTKGRLDLVKKALVAQGIPEASIVTTPLVAPDDATQDSDNESSDVEFDTVTIRITSTQACNE